MNLDSENSNAIVGIKESEKILRDKAKKKEKLFGLFPKKEEKEKMFINSLQTKYTKEWGSNKVGSIAKAKITDKKTKYHRLGYTQNPRKVEMAKIGKATTEKRGLQAYDPKLHIGGIPLGQRQLTPYVISRTNIVCDGDDLHFVNNDAMQQMWDDIRRTCIVRA